LDWPRVWSWYNYVNVPRLTLAILWDFIYHISFACFANINILRRSVKKREAQYTCHKIPTSHHILNQSTHIVPPPLNYFWADHVGLKADYWATGTRVYTPTGLGRKDVSSLTLHLITIYPTVRTKPVTFKHFIVKIVAILMLI